MPTPATYEIYSLEDGTCTDDMNRGVLKVILHEVCAAKVETNKNCTSRRTSSKNSSTRSGTDRVFGLGVALVFQVAHHDVFQRLEAGGLGDRGERRAVERRHLGAGRAR